MEKTIEEFILHGSQNASRSVINLYEKLGLRVENKEDGVHIFSSQYAVIKSVCKSIHVHICSYELLSNLIEEGFVSEHAQHSMPLEIVDDLGNKIIASFIPEYSSQKIAIITSGGDAPGMNAAIRAVLRTGMKWGTEVYGVYSGYEGLVEDNISLLDWNAMNSVIDKGGTILMSARSKRFMQKEHRKTAVFNLAKRGINNLIIMGGDGSIKGGKTLYDEFPEHIDQLIAEGKLKEKIDLKMIGIPASIDNDIPFCDTALGSDSALHRVVESIDHIISTMESHNRIFVVEVMGRKCGWIALMASFAVGGDYVFLPEVPHKNWRTEILQSIRHAQSKGRRGITVIVSEGAVDLENRIIENSEVVDHLRKNLESDVRLLKLGHLQRGGPPSAHDRIMGTLLGIKGTEFLLNMSTSGCSFVSVFDGDYRFTPLEDVLDVIDKIRDLSDRRKFAEVLDIQDVFFKRACALMEQLRSPQYTTQVGKKIAIMHSGMRVSGMNSVLYAVIRYATSLGKDIFYVQDGFDGLLSGQVHKAKEFEFFENISDGGSAIGTNTEKIEYCEKKIAEKIKELGIDSLIIVGCEKSLLFMEKLGRVCTDIDIILIPTTISNNIPGTETTLGSDTALNVISEASQNLRLSSMSVKNTAFVLEVGGDNCGYLALMGGIASGAFESFIPERKYMLSHFAETAKRLRLRFKGSEKSGLLLIRNNKVLPALSIDAFCKIVSDITQYDIKTDFCVLGSLQQGINASPLDRINSTLLGIKAIDLILKTDTEHIYDEKSNLCGVIGIIGRKIVFTTIEKCLEQFDKELMKEKHPKWLKYGNICRSIE